MIFQNMTVEEIVKKLEDGVSFQLSEQNSFPEAKDNRSYLIRYLKELVRLRRYQWATEQARQYIFDDPK